jgi:hypothetical protein
VSRHSDLLAYAAQREQAAEQARQNRDSAPYGSHERAAYGDAYENAAADARHLRFTVADEQWKATR